MQSQLSTHKSAEILDIAQCQLVTMRVDRQLLGIPVERVRDVLKAGKVAHIPLARNEISGSMNLRGRIVTVVDMRTRLGLTHTAENTQPMFVVVEHNSEFYSLRVDSVGDVLTIANASIEKSPSNLAPGWRDIAIGVHRLQSELLVIVDIDTILSLRSE
ncbi:MAG: chemotaxis protein CheW [Alphaproteobacteria bacterium]